MASYRLETLATDQNFDETAYLLANPDVAQAVKTGTVKSGLSHFHAFGRHEARTLRLSLAAPKRQKLARIKPLLRTDLPWVETPRYYDFLSAELRSQFNIIDTDAVSSNGYDTHALELIQQYAHGLVLDCGAGKRPVYFDNVINFEIADYDTTDLRGVGEVLPLIDNAVDAVISIAVLEHVKDPFLCAKEIVRVLKPGGRLMCCVPFLQPLHGYPHHYYNMTSQGLENLFKDDLKIETVTVYDSILPIWSLTWILQSWANGLAGKTRQDFLQMRVADLIDNPARYLDRPFVKDLSAAKNLELASATVLFAHKPMTSP
ncbi:MAG: class I SAM-dependent methyltransferase [Nodosilinea sp.]